METAADTGHCDAAQTRIGVRGGALRVDAPDASDATDARAARLEWPEHVSAMRNGEPVTGRSCSIGAEDQVELTVAQQQPRVAYDVEVARDRMQATLRVECTPGVRRALRDSPAMPQLVLEISELEEPAPAPRFDDAQAAVQDAGVSFGVDDDGIRRAIADPGREHVIATGQPAEQGRDGQLDPAVNFAALARTGVLAGVALMRIVPRIDGSPGFDVTGQELRAREARDAKLRLGSGVVRDDDVVRSTADGAPAFDEQSGAVSINEELVLDAVDCGGGDVDFSGSVIVNGNVQDGRRVVARHRLVVSGNADRAWLESGGDMSVGGTVMSSVLRAGGDRAVAARIVDMVEEMPRQLAEIAARAGELRNAASARGQEMSFGLSVQVVTERLFARVPATLEAASAELAKAGEQHAARAARFHHWSRSLATAAIANLSSASFADVVEAFGAELRDMAGLVRQKADLVVNYVQASEAEATGTVTLSGKGIFNSKIVAWDGVIAQNPTAVVRGGSITAHGDVRIHEIGSPGGSLMHVHLGKEATLRADLVHGGTVIDSPGGSHRFIADRSDVQVHFRDEAMQVDSFAA